MTTIKQTVKEYALELGFDLVRVTSAQEFAEDRAAALERLRDGLMDGLPWYHQDRVLRGTTPQALLEGARSIICLGLSYYLDGDPGGSPPGPAGKVARYAWVRDYHEVMKGMMRDYVKGLGDRLDCPIAARWYVDDGPMLDRAAARRSGLGWFGKNTNILTPSHGSWLFLGQIITDLEIASDAPLQKTCGACVRCIDACPTGAIIAPYVIDNTRCISYLTIENRGPIPRELRPQMEDWVFGCDICQDVCPVNRKALPASPRPWRQEQPSAGPTEKETPKGTAGGAGLGTLGLVAILQMSEDEFRRRFRGSAILRAKREGLQRNACVALGNLGDPLAIPALCQVLTCGEPLVRRHAAWALGRLAAPAARQALEQASLQEKEPEVLEEITFALADSRGPAEPVAGPP